ncbi:MAG: hypothetical protein JXB50_12450 [Spirochaetes bacterium]|nr:hypothetical protein [Spirochaetota bacterium]
MKKIILFMLSFILVTCVKSEKPEKKIQFIKWNDAIIEKNSLKVATSEISDFKRAVFTSSVSIEILKNAYIENGYTENPENSNIFKNNNIIVKLIKIDDNKTNIFIEIKP